MVRDGHPAQQPDRLVQVAGPAADVQRGAEVVLRGEAVRVVLSRQVDGGTEGHGDLVRVGRRPRRRRPQLPGVDAVRPLDQPGRLFHRGGPERGGPVAGPRA
jgi:hypothetical protein